MGLSMSCNNIQIAPFQLKELVDFKIEKKINNHTRLYFKGVVPEDLKETYVEKIKAETQVEVNLVSESENAPLFKGIAVNVEVKAVRNIYYLQVEAVSNTYMLDVTVKNHSFQKEGMSYDDIIKKVIGDEEYPGVGVDFKNNAANGKSIEKFTMQYQETDWEFLKRMASRFNQGLVPDSISDKPKFYFGPNEKSSGMKLEEFDYSVRKKISDFRVSSENHIKGLIENDFVYYEVETVEALMDIGTEVSFKGKSLYVSDAVSQLVDGILTHTYSLTPKMGLSQNKIYNDKIIGLSLEGEVLEVSKDNIKVWLIDIDKKKTSAGEAWFFHYSANYTAEGNSGWYCMPETGDHVLVHFPDNKEENGVSIGSVRKDSEEGSNNKVGNPDIKYFRTKSGKELMFSQQEILISAKDGETFIKLSESDGIMIYSTKPVKIMTKEDLVMSAEKNVVISAKDKISMTCKDSSITMDGMVSLKGKEVKTN